MSDSVFGDKNYEYIEKDGHAAGFTAKRKSMAKKMIKKSGMKDLSKRFAKHADNFERIGHQMTAENKRTKGIAF